MNEGGKMLYSGQAGVAPFILRISRNVAHRMEQIEVLESSEFTLCPVKISLKPTSKSGTGLGAREQ